MNRNNEILFALYAYNLRCTAIAKEFYGDTNNHQPSRQTKEALLEQCVGFYPTDVSFLIQNPKFDGDIRKLAYAIDDAGYKSLMRYKQGNTATTYIAKNTQDEWSLIRLPKQGKSNPVIDQNPLNYQPIQKIGLPGAPDLSIMPLVPVIHPEGMGEAIVIRAAASFLEQRFKDAGLEIDCMMDIGLLPNGVGLFVDPDKCKRKDNQTADSIQAIFNENYAAYKIGQGADILLDYVSPEGKWVQQNYFPFVQ